MAGNLPQFVGIIVEALGYSGKGNTCVLYTLLIGSQADALTEQWQDRLDELELLHAEVAATAGRDLQCVTLDCWVREEFDVVQH